MLTLRPTRAEDLDTVMDLVHDAQRFMATLNIDQWQDGYPDRAAFEQDMALKQSFVLTDETDLLAVCALTEIPEADYETLTEGQWLSSGEHYATIPRYAVKRRGSGDAAALLRLCEQTCRERGVRWLRVDTHRGNLAMRRFVEREGFTQCGLVKLSRLAAGDPIRVGFEKPL